jgi:hypothetical protein
MIELFNNVAGMDHLQEKKMWEMKTPDFASGMGLD